MDVHLRPATDSDREFLYSVYRQTMRDVVERTWGWDETWQRQDFERRFSVSDVSVIEAGRTQVGGLLLNRTPHAVNIVELQILPQHQGKSIGTAVIRRVIHDAARDGLDVTLSVVAENPRARRLYERLGFRVSRLEEPFIRMRRTRQRDS